MITVGNIEISDVWVGNQPVSEIWLGNQLVWPTIKDYLLDEKGQIISGIDPDNTYGANTLTYIRADGFERVKGVKYEIDQSKCIGCGKCINNDVSCNIHSAFECDSKVEYVDLGLPSGLLWATCNLGAEKETDYGLYFQWGDIKGYKGGCPEVESDGNDNAHYFGWEKYKYCNGTYDTLTKYCTNSRYGIVDNKTVLEPEDDAATVMLGGNWKIPTQNNFVELLVNTDPGDGANEYGWIENYNGTGVYGLLRKSKTNGNTIFFPAAGYNIGGAFYNVGQYGHYWSSSLDSYGDSYYSWDLFSRFADVYVTWDFRSHGMTIRAVTTTPSYEINQGKCTGCGWCVNVWNQCPVNAIVIKQ